MKISFIVLCYNQYDNIVKYSIPSIVNSSIEKSDYEIIIVDNNSIDSSFNELSKIDDVRVFNNDKPRNKSASRNIGVKNASGDYIIYLDGDDYFNSIGLYKLYLELSLGYDIYLTKRININTIDGSATITGDIEQGLSFGICSYVPSRKFIIENDIWFDEEKYIYLCEDMYYAIQIYDKMENYKYIEEWHYLCMKTEDSTSNQKFDRLWLMDYFEDMSNDVRSLLNTDKYSDYFLNSMLHYLNIGGF